MNMAKVRSVLWANVYTSERFKKSKLFKLKEKNCTSICGFKKLIPINKDLEKLL